MNGQARRRFAIAPRSVLDAGAAALLAIVLLAIGYSRVWPLTVDVGTRDDRFVEAAPPDDLSHGFHAIEDFGGTSVRWTTGAATIALPRSPDGVPALLMLRLLNSRPPERPNPHVELRAAGRSIGGFTVVRAIGGARTYRVLVPGNVQLDWALRIEVRSDTITLPDPRPLGVVVDRATLAPLAAGPLVPSLWLIAWSAGLGALAYALPRCAGAGRRTAGGLAAALIALVALGIVARPLEVLPFVQRIAALLGLGCLGIGIARLLAPAVRTVHGQPQPVDSTLPPAAPGSHGRWMVRGADLPIYLAVAWWMAPLFQLVMTADGASNVRPPSATLWIGGVLGLALAGLAGWGWLRQRTTDGARSLRERVLALFAAAALAHLGYMLWFAFHRQGPDFWILFRGARDWARGGSLYDLQAVATNHFGHVFKVPPFYGMLFVPFVFQDGERILFFHRVLNTVLIGATTLVWFRMWGLRLASAVGAGVLILVNFRPFADTLAFGQIDLALLLIVTLALWALQREHDLVAGALVALGTLFKIYPVLLLGFLLIKRRWRALAGFVAGMLLCNGVAVAVMGWEMHRIYVTEVLPRIGGSTSWVENQTIAGFLARLTDTPTMAAIYRNQAVTLVANALSGLAVLLACALALQPAQPVSTRYALQYSQFLLLMVLAVPAAWMHYETLLFVPFAALVLHLHERWLSLPRAVALAASFALIAYGNQWSFYDGTVMGILTIAGISYKFYGMLLLGGVLVSTLLEEAAPSRLASWRRVLLGAGGPEPQAGRRQAT